METLSTLLALCEGTFSSDTQRIPEKALEYKGGWCLLQVHKGLIINEQSFDDSGYPFIHI